MKLSHRIKKNKVYLESGTNLIVQLKKNYICRYYIADVTTLCYDDNTFGDTSMGIYRLNILKEY